MIWIEELIFDKISQKFNQNLKIFHKILMKLKNIFFKKLIFELIFQRNFMSARESLFSVRGAAAPGNPAGSQEKGKTFIIIHKIFYFSNTFNFEHMVTKYFERFSWKISSTLRSFAPVPIILISGVIFWHKIQEIQSKFQIFRQFLMKFRNIFFRKFDFPANFSNRNLISARQSFVSCSPPPRAPAEVLKKSAAFY